MVTQVMVKDGFQPQVTTPGVEREDSVTNVKLGVA